MNLRFSLLFFLAVPSFCSADPLCSWDFEDEAEVRQQWTTEGTGAGMAIVSSAKAASGKQSLGLVDTDSTKHAAWLSKPVDLPQALTDRGFITVSWEQLYSIPTSQTMRFSVIFLGGDMEKSTKHFHLKGDSADWSSGQFSKERHEIPIPSGATQVKFKLSSASDKGGDGEVYLDDLSVGE